MNLSQLGWSPFHSRAFEPYRRLGCRAGRVAMAHPGLYRVLTEAGEADAPAIGRLLDDPPLVGDWVALRPGEDAVQALLPRRTLLARRQPGSAFGRQALAANLDALFIVTGLDGDFSLRRIERYLVLAGKSGIEPLIVLSKADLLEEAERTRALESARALSPGTPVILWSAFEPGGLAALQGVVGPNRTAALVGSSGAGKSTLVNRLLGYEALATQPVRAGDSRGRHTTTWRQLIPLPQGWILIDMPGLREVQLWAEPEAVDSVFEDIEAIAAGCRFRDCTHTAEPGCAVRGAADPARLAQFQALRREAAWVEAQQDVSARLSRKRRDKELHRAARNMYRVRSKPAQG